MAKQFYPTLRTATQFKQDFFEAEVQVIMQIITRGLDDCSPENHYDDVLVDTNNNSDASVAVVKAHLSKLGYIHKPKCYNGIWHLAVECPNVKDTTGVNTTVDFSEKKTKKRKSRA